MFVNDYFGFGHSLPSNEFVERRCNGQYILKQSEDEQHQVELFDCIESLFGYPGAKPL